MRGTAGQSEGTEAPSLPDGIAAEAVRAQVERILASRRFATSERHRRLFHYLVEQSLAGVAGQLKEYAIGVEVFDRRASFDPQTDPIVRTELSRFRARLKDYYLSEGREDDLIIDLPKRSHCLTFQFKTPPVAELEAPVAEVEARVVEVEPKTARTRTPWRMITATAFVLIAASAGAVWTLIERNSDRGGAQRSVASIAVLPFVSLSDDLETEYFSDGLTEELIHWLAEIDGLRVGSRTSAFQFKGKNVGLRTIAAQLKVDVVLEGTVRRFSDRLRVTARLVNAADGFELRSHVWERRLDDALTVQQSIAREVAMTLRNDQMGGRNIPSTKNAQAYRLYHEGLHHANNRGELGLRNAIASFGLAVAADPGYHQAHAALADAYIHLGLLSEVEPAEAMLQARTAAFSAVKAGDELSHAHSALGSVLALYDWDWAGAEREFQHAMRLDPNDSGIREAYAVRYLLPQGRFNSALFELQFAQGLDPLSSDVMIALAKVHLLDRDPDRAIRFFEQVLAIEPGSEAVPMGLASAYLQKNLYDKALNTLHGASAPGEDEARLAVLGEAYALSGQAARARAVLDQLRRLSRHRYVCGYYVAMIHVALGQKDQAMAALEKAAAERSPLIVYLGVNPRFDSLRSEPRFIAIMNKVGLSDVLTRP